MRITDLDTSYYKIYNLNIDEFEDKAVETLPFSNRVIGCFMRNGIKTIADLLNQTPSSLMDFKGFGKKCIDEVEEFCTKLSGNEYLTVADETKTSGQTLPIFKKHYDNIAVGDFSVFDHIQLSENEQSVLEKYKEAYDILGEELVFECISSPETVLPIIQMLADYQLRNKKKHEISKIVKSLPNTRSNNKAIGYINAFTIDENERKLLKSICGSEETTLCELSNTDKVDDDLIFALLKKFFIWCSFDLEKEIDDIFRSLYAKERTATVIRLRSKKQTLEQIGETLGVTRERVRQIESKTKRAFSRVYRKIRIISKIWC